MYATQSQNFLCRTQINFWTFLALALLLRLPPRLVTTHAFLGECEGAGWFPLVGTITHSENGKTTMPLKGECRLFPSNLTVSQKLVRAGMDELRRLFLKNCGQDLLTARSLRVTDGWRNQAQKEIKKTLTCCGKGKYFHSWKGSLGEFSFPLKKGRVFPAPFQNLFEAKSSPVTEVKVS